MLFLNKKYNKYYDNYLNLYNVLLDCSHYWIDKNSIIFFEKILEEKKSVDISLIEIKEIIELYKYIYYLYKDIGKKIKYDLQNRKKMNEQFSIYLNNLDDIIKIYTNIEKVSPNEDYLKQKGMFITSKKNLKSIQNKINMILDQIEKNEHLINRKISKINIEKIQLTEY